MTTTVIIPAKNGMPWIITALESIARQTHPPDQVLVSIDADTRDRTVPEIRQRWSAIEIVSGGDRGLPRVFNAALAVAQGDWIVWQDADDWSRDDRIERLLTHAEAHPELGAIGSCADYVNMVSQPHENDYTRDVRKNRDGVQHPDDLLAMVPTRLGRYLLPPTLMVRRSVLNALGGLDTSFAYPGYDLILRLLRASRIEKLPDRLYVYRLHGAQYTMNTAARDADFERARQRYVAQRP